MAKSHEISLIIEFCDKYTKSYGFNSSRGLRARDPPASSIGTMYPGGVPAQVYRPPERFQLLRVASSQASSIFDCKQAEARC
jgi:hypothetical protein